MWNLLFIFDVYFGLLRYTLFFLELTCWYTWATLIGVENINTTFEKKKYQ